MSGYAPLGAMIASERLFERFNDGTTMFPHGYTFGGHPVSTAVTLADLDVFEREGLNDHVKAPAVAARWRSSATRPIVGDVRGEGFILRHRVGQGPGDRADLRQRRTLGAAREGLGGTVRRRIVLPHRRSRRFRHPVGPESTLRGVLSQVDAGM